MSASDVALPSDVDVDITVASPSASIRQHNFRKRPAAAASSGSNSLVLQDLNIQPTFGILDNTSEVHFQAAITYTTISATFGNLLVDGSGSTVFNGNPIVNLDGGNPEDIPSCTDLTPKS